MNKTDSASTPTPVSVSRREVLKSAWQLGAIGAGGMALQACGSSQAAQLDPAASSSAAAASGSSGNFRIDVHCHLIPDFYRLSLAVHGIVTAGGIPIPPWSPALAVGFMDEYGIQTQVLSVSEPGVYYLATAAERQAMATQINDYMTHTLINSADPLLKGRFGGFAVLPLGDLNDPGDVANACAEARRAITELKMDGIGVFSNYHGVYMGDPRFAPLFETLNELEAFVFLHPVTPSAVPPIPLLSSLTFLYEFPFDTTRAAVNMLYNGVFDRYPKIRWLLAHAGGALPFLANRISVLTIYPVLAQNLNIPSLYNQNLDLSKLYFDTALSPAPSAMESVKAVTDVSHILFATDWPFSNLTFIVPGDPAPQLTESFSSAELLQVNRSNALAQLPTLRGRINTGQALQEA
ncbi:MAG: amidohydrolase family protein [Nevskia sp.]|nr:amidohydrolase family protein [Nevskia sp.]